MLVRAELDQIIHGERGMLRGIDACLKQQCLVSAVTLIFAMLDALAALTRSQQAVETSGAIFKDWIKRYSGLESGLKCSADDLWGARCGVLHLHSPISRLSNQGKVKEIYYQWRHGPPAGASLELPEGSIVVNVDDLHRLALDAVESFNKAVEGDKKLNDLVEHHLGRLLCYRPFTTLVHAHAA
jgi:hypothetical protein